MYAMRLWAGNKELPASVWVSVGVWAVLPDLIDKPLFKLGWTPVLTGRLWAHSLLFALICVLVCRRWWQSQWPAVLALPGHLLLDGMWHRPGTLLWPLLGWTHFEIPRLHCPYEVYLAGYWSYFQWLWRHEPLQVAAMVASEAAGFALVVLAVRLWQHKRHVMTEAL